MKEVSPKNILLTGRPRVEKSTIIKKVVEVIIAKVDNRDRLIDEIAARLRC